jgi:hypothetical protein
MQVSRLSEIDLAKAMSVAPGPALEAEMQYYNAGGGAWSYDPTLSSTSDLVGAHAPLVGAMCPVLAEVGGADFDGLQSGPETN